MEFISVESNNTENIDIFKINNNCTKFIYKNKEYEVSKVFHFTETTGAFCNNEYMIKYDKNILVVYTNKKPITTISIYYYNKITDKILSKSNHLFQFKQNIYIELYNDYLIFDNVKETIKKSISLQGNDILYVTENNNELLNGKLCKWNNIIIGKVY
jgi:hypothetical protein